MSCTIVRPYIGRYILIYPNRSQYSPLQSSNNDTGRREDEGSDGQHSWIRGFIDIFSDIGAAAHIYLPKPFKAIAFAVAIFSIAIIASEYVRFENVVLVDQLIEQRTQIIYDLVESGAIAESQVDDLVDKVQAQIETSRNFTPGVALLFAVFHVVYFGIVFWILQRLFNADSPPWSVIAAVASYGMSIAAVGVVVSALMQSAAGSIYVTPSLTLVIDTTDDFRLYDFLTRLDLFTIWEFLAVGVVVARHVGFTTQRGLLFGAAALCISAAFLAAVSFIPSMAM